MGTLGRGGEVAGIALSWFLSRQVGRGGRAASGAPAAAACSFLILEDAAIPNEFSRLYAIGDIHGRLDLLDLAVAAVERDVRLHGSNALTVTLGDYIDRGPASRGVVERLADNPFPTPYVALKGNHEQMLADFLENPTLGPSWRSQGGDETLRSYGVTPRLLMIGRADDDAAARLRAALPEKHRHFLRSLRTSFASGRYFFCHAGVRPGVPLDAQDDHDLMWIRGEFLRSEEDFGKIVVHGHTPVPVPEVLANRINLDTGAFATGRLTCAVLDDSGCRFLPVAAG
ncbi:MAG: metallophosphoesterase [Pseudolabrys sp.]